MSSEETMLFIKSVQKSILTSIRNIHYQHKLRHREGHHSYDKRDSTWGPRKTPTTTKWQQNPGPGVGGRGLIGQHHSFSSHFMGTMATPKPAAPRCESTEATGLRGARATLAHASCHRRPSRVSFPFCVSRSRAAISPVQVPSIPFLLFVPPDLQRWFKRYVRFYCSFWRSWTCLWDEGHRKN